jgi:hypothetical protein
LSSAKVILFPDAYKFTGTKQAKPADVIKFEAIEAGGCAPPILASLPSKDSSGDRTGG